MKTTTISTAFGHLTDPRVNRTKRHSLINILTIAICATIAGCDDFNAFAEYGKSKLAWFETFLDLPNGIPSHDTFNDVLNRLSPTEFAKAFTAWVESIANLEQDIVALDGKVMRRTLDKANGNPAMHIVSAWSVKNNLCFGQVKVSDKSNEITAIPKLLELIDIKDSTVTTDAMGCQYKIGELVVEKEGDYIFSLKGNQGEFFDDIKTYLDTQLSSQFQGVEHNCHEEVEGLHGRIEQRTTWVCKGINWLTDRHPRWKTIQAIVVVESRREVAGGEESYERRYYVTSHDNKSAEFIGVAIRNHWRVEAMHWQLDVSFNEDQNRLRSGHAAVNVAMINKVALNLLKNEKSVKVGVKNKRLKAGWDNDYMLKVLSVGLLSV